MPGPDVLALFIPILALMIPMVVIASRHQQRMAEILRQGADEGVRKDVEALKAEVTYLRGVVHSQTLALEAVRSRTESNDLTQRIASSVE